MNDENGINKLKEYYYNFKSSKYFIPGIIIFVLLLIFIVLLIISSSTDLSSNLIKIETDLPDRIYVDESNTFNTEVFGTGNLQNTLITYETYPDTYVYLANTTLTGSKVTNQIYGLKTGEISIDITAKLGIKKLSLNQQKIAICKKLSIESLSFDSIDAVIGQETKLKIDLGKPIKCNEDFNYVIDNLSLATISNEGVIKGIKKGTTNLTISQDDLKVTLPLNIINQQEKVTGIRITNYIDELSIGQTSRITFTIAPDTALNKNVVWVSSDSNIVKVDQSGLVTGISKGTAKIIVKTKSGGYNATQTIKVK